MGLTSPEAAAFCIGAGLIVRFLFRTAVPGASRGLVVASAGYSDQLREEFVRLSPKQIASVLLLCGTLFGALGLALAGSPAVALLSGAAPVVFAGSVVRWHRARRRRTVVSQLPPFLTLLAGHVKAGHSLVEAIAETVPVLPAGIREDVAWLLQKIRLGASFGAALGEWEERLPVEEISLLVRPLRCALPAGGNVVELLERTRDILRRRNRTREKLRSLTAQARLQAVVLTLLPPAFAAALSAVDPSSFRNLVGTTPGRCILGAAAVLQASGWLTIRRILSVRP